MPILPLEPATYRRPSVVALLAVNAIPLVGVLFFGWDMFTLITIYWLETAVIGAFTLAKLAVLTRIAAVFLVPFFMLHMGVFMAGHWTFLSFFFGPPGIRGNARACLSAGLSNPEVLLMLLFLIASHGLSFYLHFWKNRPTDSWKALQQPESKKRFEGVLFEPYGRIVVMHAAILLGAVLTMVLGSSRWMFALLVVLKTAADLKGHLWLHAGKITNPVTEQVEGSR